MKYYVWCDFFQGFLLIVKPFHSTYSSIMPETVERRMSVSYYLQSEFIYQDPQNGGRLSGPNTSQVQT